jgi:hypothetical protein
VVDPMVDMGFGHHLDCFEDDFADMLVAVHPSGYFWVAI